MAPKRLKKKDALAELIEKRITEKLNSDDCSRMDIRNGIDFLKTRDALGEGWGDGFQRLPLDEPDDPAEPSYEPSPLAQLPAEDVADE